MPAFLLTPPCEHYFVPDPWDVRRDVCLYCAERRPLVEAVFVEPISLPVVPVEEPEPRYVLLSRRWEGGADRRRGERRHEARRSTDRRR